MDPMSHAVMAFRYREEATGRKISHDSDWARVMREAVRPALAGERGGTDQQQCAYQAIRLAAWESGAIPLPWSKAFARPTILIPWYQRWWSKVRAYAQSFLMRLR
jgi:hypothetical protein